MKRIGFVGLLLMAAFATNVATASSYQFSCMQTVEAQWGNFKEGCSVREKNGSWVKGLISEEWRLETGEYCAMILNVGPSEEIKGWPVTSEGLEQCMKKEVGKAVRLKKGENPLYFTLVKNPNAGGKGGTAKAEFKKLPTVKTFKGAAAPVTLSTALESISCANGSSSGEITGTSSVGKVVLAFTECKAKGTGECEINSVGASSGQIVTAALKGQLGSVKSSEALSEVGLLLEPETTKTFARLASSKCNPETTVTGSVAGQVLPVATAASEGELMYEVTSGKQMIKKIGTSSGEKKPTLEAFGLEIAEEADAEVEFVEEVEIV
jgi:hypothetical protein